VPEAPASPAPKTALELAREEAYATIGKAILAASSLAELAVTWRDAQASIKSFPVAWQAQLTGDKDRRKTELQALVHGVTA
jgi:hypothetical protein